MDIKYYKNNPTAFLQDYFGIKLLPYQKIIVDKLWNTKSSYYFIPARQCDFGYIRLLLALMNLKDDDTITVMSPDGVKEVTRQQFIKVWISAYRKVNK